MDANGVIFTSRRRDLLAKTVMDFSKILVAAALASGLFRMFPAWLRILLLCAIGVLVFSGPYICPKQDNRSGGKSDA